MPAVVAIVGVSNSGKTTLIEKLIPLLRDRGYRVGTIKHDAHGFEMDKPGKDTWRHREAGAETVLISGPGKLAVLKTVAEPQSPEALVQAYFMDKDLVLVEGFKQFAFPKFEVVRGANSTGPVCPLDSLAGLVTDVAIESGAVPRFGLEEAAAIADRIEAVMPLGRIDG